MTLSRSAHDGRRGGPGPDPRRGHVTRLAVAAAERRADHPPLRLHPSYRHLGESVESNGPVAGRESLWFAWCALCLMVASDYKFRVRPATDTLAGGIDAYILLEIALYGLVACYLLLRLPSLPRLQRLHPVLVLCCAYVALLVVSVSYSPYKSLAGVRAAETLVLLALTALGCAQVTIGDLHRFSHAFLVLVVGSIVFGMVHPTVTSYPLQAGRFTWLQLHPITTGVYVGLAFVISFSYLVGYGSDWPGKRWSRWTYALLFALTAYGLVATKTRNAVLGAALGALVVLWVLLRGRRVVLTLASVAVVTMLAPFVTGSVVAYFSRGQDSAELATLNSRTDLWTSAITAVRAEPLFGYGLSASRGLFLQSTGLGGAHNAFINVAVDIGLLGLLVWTAWLVRLLYVIGTVDRTMTSLSRLDRALPLGIAVLLLVHSLFSEGLGATSNVAGDWLFFLTTWTVVLTRAQPPAGPARVQPRRTRRPARTG